MFISENCGKSLFFFVWIVVFFLYLVLKIMYYFVLKNIIVKKDEKMGCLRIKNYNKSVIVKKLLLNILSICKYLYF